MTAVAESALRLFHGLPDGTEIVAGRNYREQQNKGATKRADDDKRRSRPGFGGNPPPPQQVRGQQQGKPAKIKKKFH